MINTLKQIWSELPESEKQEIANFVAKQMSQQTESLANLILQELNNLAGHSYKAVKSNLRLIEARLREGHTREVISQVIARKCSEWRGTKMEQYLRPATLFNAEKFNQYAGQLEMEVPRETYQGQGTSRNERVAAELKRIAAEDIAANGFTDKLG